jgi:hypothetical protein
VIARTMIVRVSCICGRNYVCHLVINSHHRA